MPHAKHLCVFYEEPDELWDLCIPLIRNAAQEGLTWLYVVDEHGADDVMSALMRSQDSFLSPGEVVDGGSLSLFKAPISVDTIVSQLRARMEAALSEGFTGLLLLMEMTWALHSWPSVAYLGEYEAALQELLASGSARAACLYNRRVFPATILLEGLRTHPGLYVIDGLYRNPHFLPPHVYLRGDARAQLRHWLRAIGPNLIDDRDTDSPRDGAPSQVRTHTPDGNTPSQKKPIYNLESPSPLFTQYAGQYRWKIHVLGRLRVYRQDGTEIQWSAVPGATLKVKTLFAYLLHRGQEGATAEELADLLWPDATSTTQSLNRLYHTVHCLRVALGQEERDSRNSPYVLNYDRRYFLALPEGTWIDTPVFEQLCYRGERLVREGDDKQARVCFKAVEKLYGGDLLADLPLEYTENIDQDWCWSQRYWLREMYLKMLSEMAGIYRRSGDTHRAIAYCEKVLQIDPCAERAHREMMRIFHFAGRLDALERQYRLCCESLKRFDGRKPSPATRTLYQSLAG